MKIETKKILILFILTFTGVTYGQSRNKADKPAFASDGQEYLLLVKNNHSTKLNVVFYPELEYKIDFIAEPGSAIELEIKDERGNLIYSNFDKNLVNEWNFKFKSLINANLYFRLINKPNKEEIVRVHITYRNIEKETEKMSQSHE